MELKDTIKMMQSEDYKERFKAEYYQLKIRREKLISMLNKWDDDTLPFTPIVPREFYDHQLYFMNGYLRFLRFRARQEGVELQKEG